METPCAFFIAILEKTGEDPTNWLSETERAIVIYYYETDKHGECSRIKPGDNTMKYNANEHYIS
jgi:hypothetical protein